MTSIINIQTIEGHDHKVNITSEQGDRKTIIFKEDSSLKLSDFLSLHSSNLGLPLDRALRRLEPSHSNPTPYFSFRAK